MLIISSTNSINQISNSLDLIPIVSLKKISALWRRLTFFICKLRTIFVILLPFYDKLGKKIHTTCDLHPFTLHLFFSGPTEYFHPACDSTNCSFFYPSMAKETSKNVNRHVMLFNFYFATQLGRTGLLCFTMPVTLTICLLRGKTLNFVNGMSPRLSWFVLY